MSSGRRWNRCCLCPRGRVGRRSGRNGSSSTGSDGWCGSVRPGGTSRTAAAPGGRCMRCSGGGSGPGRGRRSSPPCKPGRTRPDSDDWQELRSIRLRALLDSPDAYKRQHDDEAALDSSYWRSLFSSSTALFQAELDGEPVGLVAGIGARPDDIDPHAAHLGAMWVAPSARGTGVADQLVTAVVAWARETGHPRLVLRVYDATPRAAAFYRRAGFTGTAQVGPTDDDRRTMQLMTLTL